MFLGYTDTCTGTCNLGLLGPTLESPTDYSNKYLLANTEFTTNAFIKTIQINASKCGLIRLDVNSVLFFNKAILYLLKISNLF
jgi:hypothetical protein